MSARTAALIYTSADAEGARGGGFKVTSSRGDLDEDELTELASYRPAAVGLEEGALPEFATPEEVAAGPRALDYRAVLDGVAWWHVAPAGSDATGRGSNQVMHVAFTSEPPVDRPIERWRSPDWCTPFGRDEVAATSLTTAEVPRAQSGLSREAVLDGLSGARAGDLELLLVLLDVVIGALEHGEPVLLAVDDADDAAWWLAAVTHLLPLASAARVTFSVLSDASIGGPAGVVDTLRHDGVVVGCVLREALSLVDVPDGVAVVDVKGSVSLGLGGEPHEVAGRGLPATETSGLALELLVEPELAAAAMAWVDDTLAPTVEPRWALAAALMRDPDRYADVIAGAGRIVVTRAPADIPNELATVAERALDALLEGASAAQTWATYTDLGPENAFRARAAAAYVARALTDRSWLSQIAALPLPDEPVTVPESKGALESLAEWARNEPGDASQRALLNAVALLAQVGAVHPAAPRDVADHEARECLALVLASRVPQDAPDHVWRLLEVAPSAPILRPALVELAIEELSADTGFLNRPVGERLDPRLTRWLIPDINDLLAPHAAGDLVAVDRLVQEASSSPAFSPELTWAFTAAVVDLEVGGPRASILGRFEELDPETAASLLTEHGEKRRLWLGDDALMTFLLTAPWTATVAALCAGCERSMLTGIRGAARLRLLSRAPVWREDETGGDIRITVSEVLPVVKLAAVQLDDRVAALLQVIHVRAELGDPGSSRYLGTQVVTGRVLGPGSADRVQRALLDSCAPRAILTGFLRTTGPRLMAPQVGIRVRHDGADLELLEVLARRVLAESNDHAALIRAVEGDFAPKHGPAVQETLGRLVPRGARLAQGVGRLLGFQRPDNEEEK